MGMRIFAWGKQEPLLHPYVCLVHKKGEKVVKTSILHYFHVDIITFQPFQIVFSIEYQHTSTVECC